MATETEKRRMRQAMAHACDSVGGHAALARAILRPEEAVADWANGNSLVDPELVVEIERITGGVALRVAARPELHFRRSAMTKSALSALNWRPWMIA
jgi:DNA-binding transcriptional regulator YdaS (Cro superfamily)